MLTFVLNARLGLKLFGCLCLGLPYHLSIIAPCMQRGTLKQMTIHQGALFQLAITVLHCMFSKGCPQGELNPLRSYRERLLAYAPPNPTRLAQIFRR